MQRHSGRDRKMIKALLRSPGSKSSRSNHDIFPSLFNSQSVRLSVCLFVLSYVHVFIWLHLTPSFYLFLYISLFLSVCLSACISLSLSIYIYIYIYIYIILYYIILKECWLSLNHFVGMSRIKCNII